MARTIANVWHRQYTPEFPNSKARGVLVCILNGILAVDNWSSTEVFGPIPTLPQSIHRLDTLNFGDVISKVAFDAGLEGDVGRGAADTGAVEPDAGDTGIGDVHKFKVAAVGLHGRTDEGDDAADTLVD